MIITGECFCRTVQYTIDGGLHDARSCHCSWCRKAFSAQASAYAAVDRGAFRWETGEDLLTSHMDLSVGYPERSIPFYHVLLTSLGYERRRIDQPE